MRQSSRFQHCRNLCCKSSACGASVLGLGNVDKCGGADVALAVLLVVLLVTGGPLRAARAAMKATSAHNNKKGFIADVAGR